ncbi:MAG: hypothetical protein H3C68_06345 [Deltaproteobacteria bacterium]|nr:hypothetical protein [Deltaproteobacteria bacterium]MBZ0219625.1 hypothetical protein [Deltaproteobacteria bacterium]
MRKAVFFLLFAVAAPSAAFAYPNGTPMYLTDTGPFCASCHSAMKAEYMPEVPPDLAKIEGPLAKHYGLVRAKLPPSPYIELTDEEKEEVIRVARLIDSRSSVTISAPESVKAGAEMIVEVKARGGNGPVIGIMLVDRALRFQSRPVSSAGWQVMGEPEVRGQDGKPQRSWFEKRSEGLPTNLNYVAIEGQSFDLERDSLPGGTVTYRLKAPLSPGVYTLAAAFLYGTENTDKAGFFQRPSGRILFSEEIRIRVE